MGASATVAVLHASSDARAADPPSAIATSAPPRPAIELRHDLRVDVPVTAGLAVGLVSWNLFVQKEVLPTSCRWCDGERPDGVNAVDRFFRDSLARRDPHVAGTLSHVVAYGLGPVTVTALTVLAANHERQLRNSPLDVLLVAESAGTALTVVEVMKALVARERPGIHQIEDPEAHATATQKAGSLLSFPSGHTASVFALTSAAGMIASMRGYRLAPLIWIAGSVLGVTAAFLRISANQHYFTDTLGGAAVGALVGAGTPWLFHRPVTGKPGLLDQARLGTSPTPLGQGRMITLTVVF